MASITLRRPLVAVALLLLKFAGRQCSGFAPAKHHHHPSRSFRTAHEILKALPKDGTLEVFRTYADINNEKEEVNQVTEAFNLVRIMHVCMSRLFPNHPVLTVRTDRMAWLARTHLPLHYSLGLQNIPSHDHVLATSGSTGCFARRPVGAFGLSLSTGRCSTLSDHYLLRSIGVWEK